MKFRSNCLYMAYTSPFRSFGDIFLESFLERGALWVDLPALDDCLFWGTRVRVMARVEVMVRVGGVSRASVANDIIMVLSGLITNVMCMSRIKWTEKKSDDSQYLNRIPQGMALPGFHQEAIKNAWSRNYSSKHSFQITLCVFCCVLNVVLCPCPHQGRKHPRRTYDCEL